MSFFATVRREGFSQSFKHLISMPFIYAVFPAAVIFHFFIELYHTICFPLYGIEYVDRKKYIKLDRHKLSYLNWIEKINCVYCGYVNGLLAYAVEIAARTERYWCPIRHKERKGFMPPQHHQGFAHFGDAKAFEEKIEERQG